jgi:hypothetical protein
VAAGVVGKDIPLLSVSTEPRLRGNSLQSLRRNITLTYKLSDCTNTKLLESLQIAGKTS